VCSWCVCVCVCCCVSCKLCVMCVRVNVVCLCGSFFGAECGVCMCGWCKEGGVVR